MYVRDAYGPLAGFLYSWTWLLIAKPASIATVTTGLARILAGLSGLYFLSHPWITNPFTVNYGQLVAIAAVILVPG